MAENMAENKLFQEEQGKFKDNRSSDKSGPDASFASTQPSALDRQMLGGLHPHWEG